MENKINELLQKCIKSGLQFKFSSLNYDTIEVWSEFGKPHKLVGKAFISNWIHATPEQELDKVHDAVDKYLEVKTND